MKFPLTFLLFLLQVYFICTYLNAQSFYTNHIKYNFHNFQINNDGIYNNFIYDVYQDKKGFIWLCTLDGLFRYDGCTFKHYQSNTNQANSISGNSPVKILSGKKDGFWIGVRSTGITLSGEGLDYFDSLKETFVNYLLDPTRSNNSLNIINYMLWDASDSFIWIGTDAGLVQFFPRTKQHKIIANSSKLKVYSLEQKADSLWIGTSEGLYIYENSTLSKVSLPIETPKITDILFISSEQVLLGTSKGLLSYSIKSEDAEIITYQENLQTLEGLNINKKYINNVKKIYKDREGIIWVGTQAGLFIFDKETNNLKSYCNPICQNNSYLINRVNALFQDKLGALWVGKSNGITRILSLKGKLQKYELENPPLAAFAKNNNPRMFNINGTKRNTLGSVKVIYSNGTDFDWVGTSLGLYQFDPEKEVFFQDHELFQKIPALQTINITSILVDSRRQLWVGGNNNTTHPIEAQEQVLYRFDAKESSFLKFSSQSKKRKISTGSIKSMVEDSLGNIWLASARGLVKYITKTNSFVHYKYDRVNNKSISSNQIRVVYKDKYQRIWIGTNDAGLNLYQYDSNSFLRFKNGSDKNTLTNNRINTLYHATNDWIWVGTELGLNKIHPFDFHIERIPLDDKTNKIKGIIEREPGNLWISTHEKLFTYNYEQKIVTNYTVEDGVKKELFINNACHKTKRADILYGTATGLYRIPKNIILKNELNVPLEYTSILIDQKELEDSSLIKDFYKNNRLVLGANQNNLSFQFSILDYNSVDDKKYRYWLKGYTSDWQLIGARNEIHFNKLPPGEYTLYVEGGTCDRFLKAKAQPLAITIIPPWYWNDWSKLFYCFLLVGLVLLIYCLQLNQAIKLAEAKRLKELNSFKSKMYTNITHEIKSPISVIQGIVSGINDERYNKQFSLIKRSSAKLTRLVDDILTLNKIETGKFPINLKYGDVISFISYLLESFQVSASELKIDVTFLPQQLEVMMDYDPDILSHIVTNLLSNAIKFTPEGEQITIMATPINNSTPKKLELKFINTGKGIETAELPRIFDEFYQAKTNSDKQNQIGTGIGLSFTKELVELLNGKITVASELGKSTTFIVQLPISRAVTPTLSTSNEKPLSTKSPTPTTDGLSILVVEDMLEAREYLKICLQNNYKILTADNGKLGLKIALEEIPDIIISDIKMPQLNGFDLCKSIRADFRTSHIPFIFLTGKTDQLSKITGIKQGADAYLYKPFNEEELLVRIDQLVQRRKKMQQYLLNTLSNKKPYLFSNKLQKEAVYLNKIRNIVEANLENSQFNVVALANELYSSRTTVLRKVKSLTGKSISDYIKLIRLQKANALLSNTNLTIGEIAVKVGFKEHAYFTKCYREQYGFTPKERRNR